MRNSFVKWLVPCAIFFLAIGATSNTISAQPAPWHIDQGSDGTLYLVTGDTRYVVNPDPISDDDLAALADGGTVGSQLPVSPAPRPPSPPVTPASSLPTDMPPALDSPFAGTPEDVMLQPSALGTGWSMLDQHRDNADATTTGTLTTRFADTSGSSVVARVTVFRNRGAALAGWIYANMAGGSLNICDASWYPESTDPSAPTPIHGECLVQNVIIGMEGAPYQLTRAQIASMGRRVTGTTGPVLLPTSPTNTPVPLSSTPVPATAVPAEQPITVSGYGDLNTKLFTLRGGNYSISWTVTSTNKQGGGFFAGFLHAIDSTNHSTSFGDGAFQGNGPKGQTQAYNVTGAQYYFDIISTQANWTVTVAPQ